MCRILRGFFSLLLLLFVFTSTCFAQFPYTFDEKAHNTNYGLPAKAAFGKDGVVFISAKSVLRAYKYDGASFTHLVHIDGDFGDIAVTSDGTLLAFNSLGLSAFTFRDSVFQLISSADDYYGTVTVGPDGTVYTANSDTLKAYHFNGTAFTSITKIANPAGYTAVLDISINTVIVAAADSILYTAGPGGLYVYKVDGDILIQKDSINYFIHAMDISTDGTIFITGTEGHFGPSYIWAFEFTGYKLLNKSSHQIPNSFIKIETGRDGSLFLAGNGIAALKYDGISFSETATDSGCTDVESITSGEDGTLIIADGFTGLYASSFNGTSFSTIAHAPDAGIARSIYKKASGGLLLSNSSGLFEYDYNNSQFITKAFIQYGNDYPSGIAYETTEGLNNTIFTANGYGGIRAFTYRDDTFINAGLITGDPYNPNNIGYPVSVTVAKNGIIFIACSNHLISQNYGLHALDFDGNEFERLAYEEVVLDSKLKNNGCVRIDSSGNIFLGGDILQVFTFEDSNFTEIANLDNGMPVTSIAFGNGGIVYLTHADKGISAYRFDGLSFTLVRHAETYNLNENPLYKGSANEIAVNSDGTIFLANGRDGLRAFNFEGEFFQLTAHYGYNYSSGSDGAVGVALGKDGTVFLANSDNGLRALTYTPVVSVDEEPSAVIKNYKLYQNYPNPFNPETRIKYSVPAEAKVTLEVYNILGEKVLTLINGNVTAGEHEVSLNANNLTNGVYIFRLKAGDYTGSQKMVLLK